MSIRQEWRWFFYCVGVLLLPIATSAHAVRPLIPITGAPSVDVKVQDGCPSPSDTVVLNISTAPDANTTGTLASSARATNTNIVDVYAALLRPDGHLFGLNSLSEPDVLYPLVSGWEVVTLDGLTATIPMSEMPINEAGFYSIYIAFFESQNRSSAGRPLVALPPGLVAAAYTEFHTDPSPGAPTASKCACTSNLWNLVYHATTIVDTGGAYKLTAAWDGTLALNATGGPSRPLVLIPPPPPPPPPTTQVTGSGTLTLKETGELPSLGCVGTTSASVPVTVTGTAGAAMFDLTVNSPAVNTTITMNCTGTTPPGSITIPFTLPAYSSSVTVPAVDGAQISMTDAIPLPTVRPVIAIRPVTGPAIRIDGNYKVSCVR